MSLPVYNIVLEGIEGEGLYGISIVDNPANQHNFVTLNEDNIQLKVENKDKQIITGVVLVPNQLIYRNDKKLGKHYITFDRDTIEQLNHQLFRDGMDKNSWLDHNTNLPLKGNVIVESWIINSETKDKAFTLGFKDLPVGTWMISMKLSDENWKEYIKTGKAKGFSIDGYLRREIRLMSNNKQKTKTTMLSRFFKKNKTTIVKMSAIEVDGKELVADSFEEGQKVVYFDEEGAEKAFAEGSFEIDGNILTTDKDGIIISKIAKEAEEAKLEVEVEVDDNDELEGMTPEQVESFKQSLRDAMKEDEAFAKAITEVVKELEGEPEVKEDEVVEEALKLASEKPELKEKLKVLFEEDIKAVETKLSNMEEILAKTPNTGKLKAKVELTNTSRIKETTLEAISRINASLK